MKRSTLILLSILAIQTVECWRQHGPPHPPPPPHRDIDSSGDSASRSSESDSSIEEDIVLTPNQSNQNKRIDPDRMIQLQQKQEAERMQSRFEGKKNNFFDRPSSDELDAYDEKVRHQKNNRFVEEEPVMIHGPMDPVRAPKPMKPKMDDADEKLFLAALGQIYLNKLDDESQDAERFPGPPGPIGPMGPPPPVDYDYVFVPYETPGKVESNNNGNNNVHVNVNHVQVNSNVLHVPEKKKDSEPKEMAPIVPSYHYSEPVSSSNYMYFNFNMIDCAILFVLVAVFLFATKKAYKKCFPKKIVAPQLPTSLPPTYTPSSIVVETVSKKTPQ
ncbi:unnamed protein product [Caenorhabditis nigoni]